MFNNRKVAGKADSVKLQDVPPQKPRKLAQQPKLYYISLYTCLTYYMLNVCLTPGTHVSVFLFNVLLVSRAVYH